MLSVRNEAILPDNHRNITFTFLINCKCPSDDDVCHGEKQETQASEDLEQNPSIFKWFDLSLLSDYERAEVNDIETEAWQWACRLFTKGIQTQKHISKDVKYSFLRRGWDKWIPVNVHSKSPGPLFVFLETRHSLIPMDYLL